MLYFSTRRSDPAPFTALGTWRQLGFSRFRRHILALPPPLASGAAAVFVGVFHTSCGWASILPFFFFLASLAGFVASPFRGVAGVGVEEPHLRRSLVRGTGAATIFPCDFLHISRLIRLGWCY